MQELILATIRDIEARQHIKVLYACESGSRAWGFASPDSDWDVRFIYMHPCDYYLALNEKADTIDLMLPNDLDLAGWDLKKMLKLFASCNLALNEWINSPLIYTADEQFHRKIKELIPFYFNPIKAHYHYLSMAKNSLNENLQDDYIKIKKLFYVLRPILACEWILKNHSMPPTEYDLLLTDSDRLSPELKQQVLAIQEQKKYAVEGHKIQLDSGLLNWIKSSITELENASPPQRTKSAPSWETLNEIFRATLRS